MKYSKVGISGFSSYFPPYRVKLEDWCNWTGSNWDKINSVVGKSFRMKGPDQSIYTLAASAVIKLIDQYKIDPSRIAFLGLGTESSTDNSAGAIIIKGMIDKALNQRGLEPINRNCEVPEIKHACLGGIYSLKNALRYLTLDNSNNCAIVVSADIAEYARGSSGEPTQGAGAVAMLLEKNPKILEINLSEIGTASSYREIDFRKPVLRNIIRGNLNCHFQDLPVFNGKYTNACYLDETTHALKDMMKKSNQNSFKYFNRIEAVFTHRPYHYMPITSFAMSYLFSLSWDKKSHNELKEHCENANINFKEIIDEMSSNPDFITAAKTGNVEKDIYPKSIGLLKKFRETSIFRDLVKKKLTLGSEIMKEIGNVYCAALPAWISAGLEEAANQNISLTNKKIVAIGYGSGDAAESIPMQVVEGWKNEALKIGLKKSLQLSQNLSEIQYNNLHDKGKADNLTPPEKGFTIESVGSNASSIYSDEGIEYYQFID
ncbi:MAG: hydroxymethylglutaryl-CoA synthase [Pseudomonadota bacterium]|nr:hydroxymethylglutaryl-CoA synthase [Gammaproteobacteria bacterium]MEE2683604.1 hydroxymethylglutaryl-CoA synthase [Pseudomonadota bacterium]